MNKFKGSNSTSGRVRHKSGDQIVNRTKSNSVHKFMSKVDDVTSAVCLLQCKGSSCSSLFFRISMSSNIL